MSDRQKKVFLSITIGLFVFGMLINWDIIEFNKNEEPVVENENINDDTDDVEVEEKEIEVPPIQPPKYDEQNNKEERKEEVKEIDGEKILVKSTPEPKEKEPPEAMEKPKSEPKPTNPPKLADTQTTDKKDNGTTKVKNSEKPPTYKKEEKPKVVNGGTGSDGVVRDLNGNPIHVEGDPNAKPVEVKGSDLLPEGEKAGEGDKF